MFCHESCHMQGLACCLQERSRAGEHVIDISGASKIQVRAPLRDTHQTPLDTEEDKKMLGLHLDRTGCDCLRHQHDRFHIAAVPLSRVAQPALFKLDRTCVVGIKVLGDAHMSGSCSCQHASL